MKENLEYEIVPSINVANKDNFQLGYLNKNNGAYVSNSGMYVTDFIPVSNGDVLHSSVLVNNENFPCCLYDENKAYLGNIIQTNGNFTIADPLAKFIRIVFFQIPLNAHPYKYMVIKNLPLPDDKYISWKDGYAPDEISNNILATAIFDTPYKNLLDISDRYLNQGTIDPATGLEAGGAGVFRSLYIPVDPNRVYTGNFIKYNWGACYDENKSYICSISDGIYNISPSLVFMFKNPAIKYIRVTFPNGVTPYITVGSKVLDPIVEDELSYTMKPKFMANMKDELNPLRGLKWNALGDSITAYANSYANILAASEGMYLRNYGVNGSTITTASTPTGSEMVARYATMDNDADIITVFGGINDINNRMPIGYLGEPSVYTFYGALDALLKGLLIKYPGKSIGFITPLNYGSKGTVYHNAIKEVCAKYSIPLLDLRSAGIINTVVPETGTAFFSDGLHPNDAGHEVIAYKRIIGFIRSLVK